MRNEEEILMWLAPSALLVGLGYMMNSVQQAGQMLSDSIAGLVTLSAMLVKNVAGLFVALNQARTTPPMQHPNWELVLVSFTVLMLVASILSAVVHERGRNVSSVASRQSGSTSNDPSLNQRR
jgi:uncharacterized membrane-anchored protein